MNIIRRITTAIALCAGSTPATASPQAAVTRTLGTAEATSEVPFTQIAGVLELRDGRVIVLDFGDAAVKLLDNRLSHAAALGRNGSGPGEYAIPLRLFALTGDSAAIVDLGNTRLLVITPDGNTGGFVDPRLGRRCGAIGGFRYGFSAIDGLGNLYVQRDPVAVAPSSGARRVTELAAVERWSLPCHIDTVAWLPNPWGPAESKIVGEFVVGSGRRVPYAPRTIWAVARDGRFAIVRPEPYRVDFVVDASRRLQEGKPIAYDRIRVTESIKRAWRKEKQRPVRGVTVYRKGGGIVTLQKVPFHEPDEWPEFLPPFLDSAATFAPNGDLWIRRTTKPGDASLYDVVNQNGRVSIRVSLLPRARVIAFGKATVYVIRIDEDDLEHLERYPYPPSR